VSVDRLRLPGLDGQLDRIEKALLQAVAADDAFLTDVAGHLVRAGGKRVRPLLVLGAARAAGADVNDPDVVAGGVAVELVHLGSLYHDDVMDEAAIRRGRESVNHRWGNLVAILAGDFLLARASEIAASLGTEVAGLLAQTIGQLCQGEVRQLEHAFQPDRPEDAYWGAIAGKTASLMATSTRIGALVAGADRTMVDTLTEFGRAYGMTFQVWDDIRDLVASEDELGKPAGHDLVEGTYTLPVLRALAVPDVGDQLRDLLGGPLDDEARDRARDLVVSCDVIENVVAEARQWAGRAGRQLEIVANGNGRVDLLSGIADQLLAALDQVAGAAIHTA
jgi:heptaprenyl diphosphate synthase